MDIKDLKVGACIKLSQRSYAVIKEIYHQPQYVTGYQGHDVIYGKMVQCDINAFFGIAISIRSYEELTYSKIHYAELVSKGEFFNEIEKAFAEIMTAKKEIHDLISMDE